MTESISIDVNAGQVRVLPVPVTATDITLLTGPATFYGWSLREASGELSQQLEGSAAAPTAGTVIVTLTVATAGTYTVKWSVELAGAVAAADSNNFGLYKNAVLQLQSLNPAVVGVYPQPDVQVVCAAGDTISIRAIANATAATTYSASESVVVVQAVAMSVEIQDGNQPLAEVGARVGDSSNEIFGSPGVTVMNQIRIHVVAGVVTGVVYAGFDTQTG
jgi:hypothetical protein